MWSTDHPRACGELGSCPVHPPNNSGSSPRMRGTLLRGRRRPDDLRIIPAHAGNSPRIPARKRLASDHPRACGELGADTPATCPWSDHPRACGELEHVEEQLSRVAGSSPRMRGTRPRAGRVRFRGRIIPAHAGNSPTDSPCGAWTADHPRACGELSGYAVYVVDDDGSSPRMRGTHCRL